MKRFDAVNIIDNAMESGEGGVASASSEGVSASSSQSRVNEKSAPGELGVSRAQNTGSVIRQKLTN